MTTTTPTLATTPGFYHLGAVPSEQVRALVGRALQLGASAPPQTFPTKALALLFLNPSLRTQASFQRAAQKLDLDLLQLSGSGVWGLECEDGSVMDGNAAEHVREAAPVLSRYADLLAVRAFPKGVSVDEDFADPVMRAFREHAEVPVINMESSLWHPCQALADWTTLEQLQVPARAKLVLTWAWHPKPLPHAVPNSTLCMAAQRGMDVVVLRPEGYDLHPSVIADAEALADENGGSVSITSDRAAALKGAAAVYAKSWGSLDHWGDADGEAKQRADLRDWCVQPDWLDGGAHFMHCLPVRRNVVVADAVLDSAASVVLTQAENRLHAQTALLEDLLS